MPGSSRSLIKAMESLFDHEQEVDGELDELMVNIDHYLDKHNTTAAIAQTGNNVSEELLRIYTKYIKPQLNIRREYLFLDVVGKLLPVLNQEEVSLWLQTYMKPAFDSAGYDLIFVQKSRSFLKRITSDTMDTDDDNLKSLRLQICNYVIKSIVKLYCGEDVTTINLTIPKERDHVFLERFRFIKENCFEFLKEFGRNKANIYFQVLNESIINPTYRLDILSLISSQISIRSPQNYHILNSGLFDTLLDGLIFELNEIIIVSELSILIMLIPQIPIQIGSYLTKLFAIYLRVCCWDDIRKIKFDSYLQLLKKNNVNISLHSREVVNEYLYARIELESLHLATILYGLFPLHFSKFCQNPIQTIGKESKTLDIITESIVIHEELLQDKLNTQYRSFLVHPKFLYFDDLSMENEIDDPLKWLNHTKYDEESIGPVEISLGCFSLNPDIIINDVLINQQYALGNHKLDSSLTNSMHASRASSIAGPMYMNVKEGLAAKALTNFNRKLSIVPTNLVIDAKYTNQVDNYSQSSSQNLKFMDYKFGEISTNSAEETSKDPLGNLFSTHERLFHKSNSFNSSTQVSTTYNYNRTMSTTDEGNVSGSETNKNITSNTDEQETSSSIGKSLENSFLDEKSPNQLANSSSNTSIEAKNIAVPEKSTGSGLDFYHRELLLLKNELEFSSYMKHLNKFYYIKLKSKILNNNEQISLEKNTEDNSGKIENLKKSFQEVSLQLKETNENHRVEIGRLVEELARFKSENKDLKFKLDDLRSEYEILSRSYEVNVKDAISDKDQQLEILRNKVQELQSIVKTMKLEKSDHTSDTSLITREESVTGFEQQLYSATETITSLQEVNNKLKNDLKNATEKYDKMVKSYESKVEASKMDARDNTDSYVKIYEKRVSQLLATIHKFEALLDEKNARILQLSSSRPILIPTNNIGMDRSSNDGLDYIQKDKSSPGESFYMQNSNFTPTPNSHMSQKMYSTPNSHTGPQTHFPFPNYLAGSRPTNTVSNTTVQQQPTLKGRGGYQKRSKKLM